MAQFEGLKMVATGFDKSKNIKGNGITSMYNFRFESALKDQFAFCRIPCYCIGCYERLQLNDVAERYGQPRETCYLWPIMQMKDKDGNPIGKGYNDWKLGKFEMRSDCKVDQYHALKADTLRGIGERYSEEIIEGDFGAYCIADDKKYPYYIVEWVGNLGRQKGMRLLKLVKIRS